MLLVTDQKLGTHMDAWGTYRHMGCWKAGMWKPAITRLLAMMVTTLCFEVMICGYWAGCVAAMYLSEQATYLSLNVLLTTSFSRLNDNPPPPKKNQNQNVDHVYLNETFETLRK